MNYAVVLMLIKFFFIILKNEKTAFYIQFSKYALKKKIVQKKKRVFLIRNSVDVM